MANLEAEFQAILNQAQSGALGVNTSCNAQQQMPTANAVSESIPLNTMASVKGALGNIQGGGKGGSAGVRIGKILKYTLIGLAVVIIVVVISIVVRRVLSTHKTVIPKTGAQWDQLKNRVNKRPEPKTPSSVPLPAVPPVIPETQGKENNGGEKEDCRAAVKTLPTSLPTGGGKAVEEFTTLEELNMLVS